MPIARPNWWGLQAAPSNQRAVNSCTGCNRLKNTSEEEEVEAEESQSERPLRGRSRRSVKRNKLCLLTFMVELLLKVCVTKALLS